MDAEPLESLILRVPSDITPDAIAESQVKAHIFLDRLTGMLDNPPTPPKKYDFYGQALTEGTAGMLVFDASDLPRAQELYRRVEVAGGTGSTHVREPVPAMQARTRR